MLQIILHLRAITRRTLSILASGSVLDELDVQHKIPLALLALRLRKVASAGFAIVSIGFDSDRNQLVRTGSSASLRILMAFFAQVIVRTRITVIPFAAQNFSTARDALLHKLRSVPVVQMPQDHHRRVFRSAQLVELIVVALT